MPDGDDEPSGTAGFNRREVLFAGAAGLAALATPLIAEAEVPLAESPGTTPRAIGWPELRLMDGAPPAPERLVTKANAWDAPFNRWTFQHMRNLYPSAAVERGLSPVRSFDDAAVELDQIEAPGIDGGTHSLEVVLKDHLFTDGIVVLHRGRIVYERYWNGMTARTPHWWMSVSKTITGTLAGILIDRGQIDPERTVESYIPELAGGAFGPATVNQLLDMLIDVEIDESPASLANPDSPYNLYLSAQGFRTTGPASSAYRYLPTMKAKGEPGRRYHYVTPNTDVAGWLVERVSGKSFIQLFSDEIWSKVGGESDCYYLIDPEGHALAAGGFNSSTRDLARWGLLVLQDGRMGDVQVFPARVVEDIRTNGSREMWSAGGMDGMLPGGSQRKYWYKSNDEDGSILGAGVFGNHLYINPAAGVVVAKHASYPQSSTGPLQATAIATMRAITQAILDS
jgi:CubicO group peptidase (beta-lactamase class C family)